MENRRVVVTGVGVISAVGRNVPEFQESMRAGRQGIGPLRTVDRTQLRFHNGAEVPDFDAREHFEDKQAELLDRFAQFGLIAAREAIKDSRLEFDDALRERTAVVTGSCLGGQITQEVVFQAYHRQQGGRVHPLTIPRVMSNAAAGHITMEFGLTGPAYTISTACASSGHAIGQAFWMVRSGLADLAVTGGSDAPFTIAHLKAWEALRVVAPDTCRPFSKDRRGMILGEGGAMLVLEPLESALSRGAHIHAEVVGFGMSSDAHHVTQPSAAGAARAIASALRDGRVEPQCVGYVNAHGTATQVNDPMETEAIRRIFGDHADKLAVSSTKSMHGHALGAAGAIEAVATVLALECGVLPPTVNFLGPDPQCDLDVVPNEARPAEVEYAISNSFAFGGLNAVLAFKRWEDGERSCGG